MNRCVIAVTLVGVLGTSAIAAAQTGAGSLRGYITDEQGGALPGVTVTTRSEALIQPVASVTDAAGYYRLINLAPGTYEVSADLTGFAPFKRQDILLRAGANFQVDISTSKPASAGRPWRSNVSRISIRTPRSSTTPPRARSRTGK
jgi:hypothetical protein